MKHAAASLRRNFSTDFIGRMRWMLLLLVAAAAALWIDGVRVFVVPPFGSAPEGQTLIVYRGQGLQILDRGYRLASRSDTAKVAATLPYNAGLDRLAKYLRDGKARLEPRLVLDPAPAPPERLVESPAACLALTVDRVFRTYDHPAALVTVQNNCPRGFRSIYVNCTWLKDETPVITGLAVIYNLGSGQTDSGEANGREEIAFDSARCRISNAY